MMSVYLCIVVFLLVLAVFDLFVGVSNDAVNFLQSAVGARVAKFRTLIIIASAGVVIGAVMSSGMMDVARHVIMVPDHYSFSDVMVIFLAVMVTDIIILDLFNTLGMPTSTTVSLVFELLGGTFIIATMKMSADETLVLSDLLNSDKALQVIGAIFISVAIAFFFGVVVQWVARLVFTFNYSRHSRYSVALFGGLAFTALSYFIFLKGVGHSPYLPESVSEYINSHLHMLLAGTFVVSTLVMEGLHLLRVNIFKFVVLMGTFALAMAFAGNDLVNFIGVPLAGLDSFLDYSAHSAGASPTSFMMTSLMESAKTPPLYLLIAGIIMIVAMTTSKKAQNVIKTSVDLSRQEEGEEMFGSSFVARSLVRFCQTTGERLTALGDEVPLLRRAGRWIDGRFDKREAELPNGAAFDVVRAAVNLVLASLLITIGTNYKLPLSTTYVTFMVAMGSSLADKAWSRESAVFRVTGVIAVIGGWFITAGVAFLACSLVCLAMYWGGVAVQVMFMALVIFLLVKSNRDFKRRQSENEKSDSFRLMMRVRDPEMVWELLRTHVSRTQSFMARFALAQYEAIIDGFIGNSPTPLRHAAQDLKQEKVMLKKYRRQEILALRRVPIEIATERNTWFHVGINASTQYIYCLQRMLEPIKEHVDNGFTPLPQQLIDEYAPIRRQIETLLTATEKCISTGHFEDYRQVLSDADSVKDRLSVVRHKQIDRIQAAQSREGLRVSMVYLNLLQESQQLLSNMRHQLRAAKKFMEN